jgi:hypothetical protein
LWRWRRSRRREDVALARSSSSPARRAAAVAPRPTRGEFAKGKRHGTERRFLLLVPRSGRVMRSCFWNGESKRPFDPLRAARFPRHERRMRRESPGGGPRGFRGPPHHRKMGSAIVTQQFSVFSGRVSIFRRARSPGRVPFRFLIAGVSNLALLFEANLPDWGESGERRVPGGLRRP